MAHYDSGKARAELKNPILTALPIVKWVVLGGFVLTALLLLLGSTVFAHASGAVDIVLTVITVIGMIASALPLVQFILGKVASYNDGANCNASGVAVLMEAAARVGRGRTDMSSVGADQPQVTIHGEQAARAEGLIPEGAEVSYAAASKPVDDNATPAERLAAAKAAVAALSGKPVSDFMSEEILNASVPINMPEPAAPAAAEVASPVTSPSVEVQPTVGQIAEETPASTPAIQVEAVVPATEAQPIVPAGDCSGGAAGGERPSRVVRVRAEEGEAPPRRQQAGSALALRRMPSKQPSPTSSVHLRGGEPTPCSPRRSSACRR